MKGRRCGWIQIFCALIVNHLSWLRLPLSGLSADIKYEKLHSPRAVGSGLFTNTTPSEKKNGRNRFSPTVYQFKTHPALKSTWHPPPPPKHFHIIRGRPQPGRFHLCTDAGEAVSMNITVQGYYEVLSERFKAIVLMMVTGVDVYRFQTLIWVITRGFTCCDVQTTHHCPQPVHCCSSSRLKHSSEAQSELTSLSDCDFSLTFTEHNSKQTPHSRARQFGKGIWVYTWRFLYYVNRKHNDISLKMHLLLQISCLETGLSEFVLPQSREISWVTL